MIWVTKVTRVTRVKEGRVSFSKWFSATYSQESDS